MKLEKDETMRNIDETMRVCAAMSETEQPMDVDAIAAKARDQIWNSQDGVTRAQDIIAEAIRCALVRFRFRSKYP